jgi:hypothetical protein
MGLLDGLVAMFRFLWHRYTIQKQEVFVDVWQRKPRKRL